MTIPELIATVWSCTSVLTIAILITNAWITTRKQEKQEKL